jgi:hypothetical protein
MAYPTVPVVSRGFAEEDSKFEDNRFEVLGAATIESSEITMVARIKINKIEDVAQGFHYILGQNKGNNTEPENFLRLRGQSGRVIFLCGTWRNQENHEIGFDLDAKKHLNKELNIIGRYNNTTKTWSLNINGEVKSVPDNVGASRVEADWLIGRHNFDGKWRSFIGNIYYAAIYKDAPNNVSILVADSDNNGIITSYVKNPACAIAEHAMGSASQNPTAKPITYFPNDPDNLVPKDYKHAQIRIITDKDTNLTKFRLKCPDSGGTNPIPSNLEVVKGSKPKENGFTYEENPISPNTDLIPDDGLITAGGANLLYFVRAKGADPLAPNKVELYEITNNAVSLVDSTVFEPRQTLSDWIVPSGWKINSTTITTPIPEENAVGPQTEGSGLVGSAYDSKSGSQSVTNPKGDTFSVGTYPNGFRMTLNYSFVRNTTPSYTDPSGEPVFFPEGYIQPDMRKSEKVEDQVRHNLDFVGNSGIKFGGLEFQIFDTIIFVNGFGITENDVNHGANIPSPQIPPTADDAGWICNKKIIPTDPSKPPAYYLTWNNMDFQGVKADNVISGNRYSSESPNKRWNDVNDAKSLQQLENTLEINIFPSENNKWYAGITLNNTTVFERYDIDLTSADRNIFIQSHWGSGVVFEINYIGPPQLK